MIISKENNAFVISGIFDGTLRNGKVCFPMNTTALVIDGRDIVRFIDAVSQDELFATPLRTLVYDGEFVTRETLFEDFDAVSMAAGGGPGPGPSPELNWFKITNLTNEDGHVYISRIQTPNNIKLSVSSDGTTWTDYTVNEDVDILDIPIAANGYLLFNGKENVSFNRNGGYHTFYCNKDYSVSGDLSTLVADSFTAPYVFADLFGRRNNVNNTKLIDASALILPWTYLAEGCYHSMFSKCVSLRSAPTLPATTLANSCYERMFQNCSSLTTAPALPATTLGNYCYQSMFQNCTSLTTAPALPATSFGYRYSCYQSMFSGCSSLTTAPALPVTKLESFCYAYMFQNCTALTTAPALPATTMYNSCYQSMFSGCTSLTTAPALPATTLADSCYQNMFSGCTSLTTAPELPATTLISSCYSNMFSGCSSLTTAPALPAATIVQYSYMFMFYNCTSLNYVKCLATTISTTNTDNWLKNVSSTGTFECAGGMSATWPTGTSGIPTGWTVVDPSVSQTVSFTIQGYDDAGCLPDGLEGITLTKTVNGNTETFTFPAAGTLDFTVANDASTTPITFTQDMGGCCARIVTITPSDIVENYSGVYSMSNGTTDEECECINTGGTWDPDTQTCTYPEPPTVDCATEWESQGYSSYEDCQCSNYGTDCPNYFTIINNTSNEGNISIEETIADGGSAKEISLEYSNDGGTSWTPITVNLNTAPINITLPADGAVSFRGSNPDFGSRIARRNAGAQPWQDGWSIRSTTPHAVQGDLGTLIDATNHSASGLFTAMFMNDTGLVDATGLIIPTYTVEATVLGQQQTWTNAAPLWCCQDMFRGCTSLVNAPAQLNATALMSGCYTRMFAGCTSLQRGGIVTPNNLLNIDYAQTNNQFVFNAMFSGCTNLQTLSFLGFPAAYSSGNFTQSRKICNMWLESTGAGTLTGIANLNNGVWWSASSSGLPSNWSYSGTATMPTA